jgi:hypothetical protein
MRSIFPSPFRIRELVLTFAALAAAITALLLSNSAGGGVLFLSVIIGTVFLSLSAGVTEFFLLGCSRVL